MSVSSYTPRTAATTSSPVHDDSTEAITAATTTPATRSRSTWRRIQPGHAAQIRRTTGHNRVQTATAFRRNHTGNRPGPTR